jgi:hypothetical protein
MKVTLTHEDVLEACREWVERHYGFKVKGNAGIIANLPNNNCTYEVERINISFPEAPKPEGEPYRTSALKASRKERSYMNQTDADLQSQREIKRQQSIDEFRVLLQESGFVRTEDGLKLDEKLKGYTVAATIVHDKYGVTSIDLFAEMDAHNAPLSVFQSVSGKTIDFARKQLNSSVELFDKIYESCECNPPLYSKNVPVTRCIYK